MTPANNTWPQRIPYLLLLALLFALPLLVSNQYLLHVVIMCYITAIAIYGLNLILGYTGQLSLAHAGFYGVGAYTAALLTLKLHISFWLALPLACVMTCLIGLLVGLISLRLRSHYFTIFTLCVGVILNLLIEHMEWLTEGVRGLIGIPPPNPIYIPGLGKVVFTNILAQYYLVLLCLIFTFFVVRRIVNSLVGRTFVAIRNSEELASTIGINVFNNKLVAFIASTFFAGLAGALFAGYIRFIGPTMSHPNITFEFLLALLIGGQATMPGPLVGALVVMFVNENLQFMQSYRNVIFGPFLIIVVMFFPGGLVGAYYSLKHRLDRLKNQPRQGKVYSSETNLDSPRDKSEKLQG